MIAMKAVKMESHENKKSKLKSSGINSHENNKAMKKTAKIKKP